MKVTPMTTGWNKRRVRLGFLAAAIVLLAVEVLIGLYVRDRFIRPYLGDVLVVILLYCGIRCVIPQRCRLLPLLLLLFAAAVETAQALRLVEWLGWAEIPLLATLLGTSFSWWDMLCYAVGAGICAAADRLLAAKRENKEV